MSQPQSTLLGSASRRTSEYFKISAQAALVSKGSEAMGPRFGPSSAAPSVKISSGMASGLRKAQKRSRPAAALLAPATFSKESATVVATDSGWSGPKPPRLLSNSARRWP